MTEKANWDPLLQCHWEAWLVSGPRRLRVHFPAGECCDMTGCIKRAKQLMPGVTHIVTFSGDERDTAYRLVEGKWEAFPHD